MGVCYLAVRKGLSDVRANRNTLINETRRQQGTRMPKVDDREETSARAKSEEGASWQSALALVTTSSFLQLK